VTWPLSDKRRPRPGLLIRSRPLLPAMNSSIPSRPRAITEAGIDPIEGPHVWVLCRGGLKDRGVITDVGSRWPCRAPTTAAAQRRCNRREVEGSQPPNTPGGRVWICWKMLSGDSVIDFTICSTCRRRGWRRRRDHPVHLRIVAACLLRGETCRSQVRSGRAIGLGTESGILVQVCKNPGLSAR